MTGSAVKGMSELLSSSQLSRLADVPVPRIIRAAKSGKLKANALTRVGNRTSYFFLPSAVKQAKSLMTSALQPVC